ncbi:MAG: DUF4157 domain-containing protein [Cytophagaceae bacterium]
MKIHKPASAPQQIFQSNENQNAVQKKNTPAQMTELPEEEELQMKPDPLQFVGVADEEELQMKKKPMQLMGDVEEEELQMKMKPMQMMGDVEEEELQMKPMQMMGYDDEEELQMKPMQMQGYDDEEELQMKPMQMQGIEEEEVQMKLKPMQLYSAEPEKVQMKSDSTTKMPEHVQAKMESSFGTDFSDVNIHTGEQASSVGALAYAQGNDIHFAPGQYNPETQSGQELLGHELTHVVQQRQGRVQATTQAKGLAVNDDPALEHEADVMGKKAAEGKVAEVAGKGSGVQRKETITEDQVLKNLENRSKGAGEKSTLDPSQDQEIAKSLADSNFSPIGKQSFGTDLVDSLNDELDLIFTSRKAGEKAAVTGIESSIKDEKEKKDFTRSCIIATISILNAWAPIVASATTSAIESKMLNRLEKTMPSNVKIKEIKLPAIAQSIKDFGSSTLRGAIVSTATSLNSLLSSNSASASAEIDKSNNELLEKSKYAATHLTLQASQKFKETPSEISSPIEIGLLAAEIKRATMETIFPHYSNFLSNNIKSTGIQEKAKKDLLMKIITSAGTITNGAIEGNKKKSGSNYVKHAMSALGGDQAFMDELGNNQAGKFAFSSLQSTLSHWGLMPNLSDEFWKKFTSGEDIFDNSWIISLNLVNKDMLRDKLFFDPIKRVMSPSNYHYESKGGPIKEMQNKYSTYVKQEWYEWPAGGSIMKYHFDFNTVNFENIKITTNASNFKTAILAGKKIQEFKDYELSFSTKGTVLVKKEEKRVSRGDLNPRGNIINSFYHDITGSGNKILIIP